MPAVKMYHRRSAPAAARRALLKQRGVDQIEEVRVDLDPPSGSA